MKIYKVLFSITLLFCLLSSCASIKDNVDSSSGQQWLNSLICEFPCWQNITPQKTYFDDALSILQQDSTITIDFIDQENISFQINNVSGTIDKASDGTVKSIVLFVVDLRLGDVVQEIGLPEKIGFARDPFDANRCLSSILFPKNNTILDFYLENKANGDLGCQIVIGLESSVFRILLTGDDFNNGSILDYIEWKGYGDYP